MNLILWAILRIIGVGLIFETTPETYSNKRSVFALESGSIIYLIHDIQSIVIMKDK